MDYKNFEEADFAADDYFLEWIRTPNVESDRFWERFISDFPQKGEALDRARELVLQLDNREGMVATGAIKHEIWNVIERYAEAEGDEGVKVLPKKPNRLPLRIAVGFMAVLGLSVWGIYISGYLDDEPKVGAPRITLQLQDGKKQVLDETVSTVITTAEGHKLGNQDQQVLTYEKTQENATELVYNELTVPYGKNFELVLADGSHIYLNAGSSLRYPVQFLPGQPRDVFLDGEAFFEVARDNARPFTVVTEKMNTRVYGTRFNVTSYRNEGNTYTVLVEGSVGVYRPEDRAHEDAVQKIVPGQKAWVENQGIAIEEVNVHKYTAWTSGELYFLNDRFDIILRKLERHFNVSIDNTYMDSNKEQLTSSFKGGESLETVLGILKKLQPFNYKRRGDVITITPP